MDSERPVELGVAGQMTTDSGIYFTVGATRTTFESGFHNGFCGPDSNRSGLRPHRRSADGHGR